MRAAMHAPMTRCNGNGASANTGEGACAIPLVEKIEGKQLIDSRNGGKQVEDEPIRPTTVVADTVVPIRRGQLRQHPIMLSLPPVDERVAAGYARAGRLIGHRIGTPPSSPRERDYDIVGALVNAYVCAEAFLGYAPQGKRIPPPTHSEGEVTRLVQGAMQAGGGMHEGARDTLWWLGEAALDCEETFAALAWIMRTSASKDTLGAPQDG